MSFKTSHQTRKKKGRWSKKGKVTSRIFSCPFCFSRYNEPPRKASNSRPYCSQCLAQKSEIVELKEIKIYKPKT